MRPDRDGAAPRPELDAAGGDSYYGRPILKEPVWKPQIPFYFLAGGLGGASSVLSLAARATGRERLARRMLRVALAADLVSPVLLVTDLGRPERFLNMFRLFKVTSPMSVGSWILAAEGAFTSSAVLLDAGWRLPRLKLAAEIASALFGPALATYTAVLVADTAIPVWHRARRELPFVFAGSSAAAAGAAGLLVVPVQEAGPARRFLVVGAVLEGAAMQAMLRRLGPLGAPYRDGRPGTYAKLARALTLAGTGVGALGGRRSRAAAAAGGALALAGAALLRWAVFRAGFESARDPRYVVEAQRARLR